MLFLATGYMGTRFFTRVPGNVVLVGIWSVSQCHDERRLSGRERVILCRNDEYEQYSNLIRYISHLNVVTSCSIDRGEMLGFKNREKCDSMGAMIDGLPVHG